MYVIRLTFSRFLLKFASRHESIGCGQRQGSAGIVTCALHEVNQ